MTRVAARTRTLIAAVSATLALLVSPLAAADVANPAPGEPAAGELADAAAILEGVYERNQDRIADAVATEDSTRAEAGWPQMTSRLWGANRFETAVRISERVFSDPDTQFGGVVFVANGLNFPDALAAGPAAATWAGPILLVPPSRGLPPVVRDEIVRLAPDAIVILGQNDNVSDRAERELTALVEFPDAVVRVAGNNRYQTSALLSLEVRQWKRHDSLPDTALIATGRTYADALAGGMFGAVAGAPLLLTDGKGLDPWVRKALAPGDVDGWHQEFTTIHVLGSAETVGTSVEDQIRAILPNVRIIRHAGSDRFDTAARLNSQGNGGQIAGAGLHTVLTNGYRFPDALAGATLARHDGFFMVPTRPNCIPTASLQFMQTLQPVTLTALGWTDAVSDDVLNKRTPCP